MKHEIHYIWHTHKKKKKARNGVRKHSNLYFIGGYWCLGRIIKKLVSHLDDDKFGVCCFQILVQIISIKQRKKKILMGTFKCKNWKKWYWSLYFSSPHASRSHYRQGMKQSCTSLHQMTTNGDVSPSLWYVVRMRVRLLWHIKRTLSLVTPHVLSHLIGSCLCGASPVTFQDESFFIKCCSPATTHTHTDTHARTHTHSHTHSSYKHQLQRRTVTQRKRIGGKFSNRDGLNPLSVSLYISVLEVGWLPVGIPSSKKKKTVTLDSEVLLWDVLLFDVCCVCTFVCVYLYMCLNLSV